MKLVLQCAMCGTHHVVGTPACTTCRASGVTQMRLMFECPTCGGLGINPICAACPFIEPLELDDDGLIVAEEVPDEPLELDIEDLDFDLDIDLGEDSEDEALVVDLSEESIDEEDEDFDADDEQEDEAEEG